jgi:DNA-binding transcriptional MocR family regulator
MFDVTTRLKALDIRPWLEPQAGMFLWCRLPDGLDAAVVARAALAKNVVLAPGNAFSLTQSATGFMRFNVSQTLDHRVFEVLRDALKRAERSAG